MMSTFKDMSCVVCNSDIDDYLLYHMCMHMYKQDLMMTEKAVKKVILVGTILYKSGAPLKKYVKY